MRRNLAALRNIWPSLLLLLSVHGAAANGNPVTVDVRLASGARTDTQPVFAILRIESQGSSQAAPEDIKLQVPAKHSLVLGEGTWRFRAEAEGYWGEERILSFPAKGGATVDLPLYPTGTLHGRLEVPRGDKLPDRLDLKFAPTPREKPGTPADSALPKGVVSCLVQGTLWQCAVPAGNLDLRFRAAGRIPIYRWGTTVAAGSKVDLGLLSLMPGASVTGRVVTEDGMPAKSVRVEIGPERLGAISETTTSERLDFLGLETRTNDRGFFQFQSVAPGSYSVGASDAGKAPARIGPVIVREGLEAEIIDPLILAKPMTFAVDLAPPVDPYGNRWKVRLARETNTGGAFGSVVEGTADPQGRWSAPGLAPGRYRLQVLGDLDSRWLVQEVELEPGDGTTFLVVPVVEIEGRLTLGEGPLSGTLWFGGGSGARRVRFDADEDGEFEGFLPEEGTWPVDLVSESEGLRLALEPVEVRVPRGKRAARIELRVPDTTLEGEVVDETGRRVEGASISLTGGRKVSDTTSDRNGRFTVRGLAPPYVFIEAEEADRSSGPIQVTLEDGRKAPWLRLVLRDNFEVRGKVISLAGPVPGAEVLAWPALDQVPFASDARDVTRPDGGFSLRVPARTHALSIFISAPGHAFRMARVDVQRERLLEIPLESVGGTLVLEAPRPSAGGRSPSPLLLHGGTFTPLLIIQRWAALQRVEQVDEAQLVVPNMESGIYSLCVESAGYIREGKEPPAENCASGVLYPNGELKLSPRHSLGEASLTPQ